MGFYGFCLFIRNRLFLLQAELWQKTVSVSILLIPYEKKVWLVTLDGKKDETPAFSRKKSVNLQIQNTIEFLYIYARP